MNWLRQQVWFLIFTEHQNHLEGLLNPACSAVFPRVSDSAGLAQALSSQVMLILPVGIPLWGPLAYSLSGRPASRPGWGYLAPRAQWPWGLSLLPILPWRHGPPWRHWWRESPRTRGGIGPCSQKLQEAREVKLGTYLRMFLIENLPKWHMASQSAPLRGIPSPGALGR